MLTCLQILVKVRIQVVIVFVIVAVAFTLLVLVFLLHLLATQPLEEVGYLLVVQCIRQVLRHTLETTKASVAILRTFTDIRTGTHRVCLIGIGGEGSTQIEGIALCQFQTETGIEVTPWARLGSKVIRHGCAQLVNQTDLLKAC